MNPLSENHSSAKDPPIAHHSLSEASWDNPSLQHSS